MIKVLFVDDELIVRIALKSMVQWENTEFEIVGAVSNGKEALSAIKKFNPQIIVTDLKMPKLDGLGLAKYLSEQGYKGKIIILSSYGEFEYAQEALYYGVVGYLLKASFDGDELLASLRHAAKYLPKEEENLNENSKICDVFDTEHIYNLLFKNVCAKNINYTQRYLAVYLFRKDLFSQIKETNSDNSPKEILSKLIDECISSKSNAVVVPISNRQAVIIYPLSDISLTISEIIKKDYQKISNSVEIYMNTKIGIIASNSFSCECELKNNLLECIKASQLSLYFGYDKIIKQDEAKIFNQSVDNNTFSNIENVCNYLIMSNYKSAKRTILNMLDSLSLNHINVNEAKNFIKLLFEYITAIYSFYIENNKEKLQNINFRYKKSNTIKEYKLIIIDIINEISMSLIKIDVTNYRQEVVVIINYIKNNINKKITLTDLSKAVNMSESYISRLFKNETGCTLTSYINMLKMEQAMLLLKSPNIYVKQVANALGYDDQSYFNKIFNKYFNISPNEFKHNY